MVNPGKCMVFEFGRLSVDRIIISVAPLGSDSGNPVLPASLEFGCWRILPRHNNESENTDSCAFKIDDYFITNQWQLSPWILFPKTSVQTMDFLLVVHQFFFFFFEDKLLKELAENKIATSHGPQTPLNPLREQMGQLGNTSVGPDRTRRTGRHERTRKSPAARHGQHSCPSAPPTFGHWPSQDHQCFAGFGGSKTVDEFHGLGTP